MSKGRVLIGLSGVDYVTCGRPLHSKLVMCLPTRTRVWTACKHRRHIGSCILHRLQSGKKQKTGCFLKELTQPLGKLVAAGYDVEVRSACAFS